MPEDASPTTGSKRPVADIKENILNLRMPRNAVNPLRPYAFLVEPEYSSDGHVEDVATIFLTNKECPFHCVMCDLWKNTTIERVPTGAIPEQIQFALNTLPAASHIKLYNSGNFFDSQAIPPEDLPIIAGLVSGFRTVIVENHPRLCNKRVSDFQQMCGTQVEVAMGLETSHEPTLNRLNKQMTTSDFARATEFLLQHDVRIRTFILLRPPWTSEEEGIDRAIHSVRFAFDCGFNCCAIIPTRAGNGIMDYMEESGEFESPRLSSLEAVMNETIGWKQGRIFADLWDIKQFSSCVECVDDRVERLRTLNLTQKHTTPVNCRHCSGAGA
jgi:radical SAM enzyme (TIGR01210 family)